MAVQDVGLPVDRRFGLSRNPHLTGIRRAGYKLRRFIQKRCFVDYGNDGSAIILAGSGRSGTTWISEIINYRNDHRYIFEPFHPQKMQLPPALAETGRLYLRPADRNSPLLDLTRSILAGRKRDPWMDRFNRRLFCNRRLIKVIRANLFLKWIKTNVPGIPIILLMRHPFAVVGSTMVRGWDDVTFDALQSQQDLVDDFADMFETDLDGANRYFERRLFVWCLEQYVPLTQFGRGEIHLAFYENFCEQPATELERLFTFLKQDYDSSLLSLLIRPSPTARKDSAIVLGERPVDSWRQGVDNDQIATALKILERFGLDRIYGPDPMPNTAAAYAMLQG